jgi:hypothetical protein
MRMFLGIHIIIGTFCLIDEEYLEQKRMKEGIIFTGNLPKFYFNKTSTSDIHILSFTDMFIMSLPSFFTSSRAVYYTFWHCFAEKLSIPILTWCGVSLQGLVLTDQILRVPLPKNKYMNVELAGRGRL